MRKLHRIHLLQFFYEALELSFEHQNNICMSLISFDEYLCFRAFFEDESLHIGITVQVN